MHNETFSNELVINDPENELYKEIVNRRERFSAWVKFIVALGSYASGLTCLWLLVTTSQERWLFGAALFWILGILNAQVLNYRVILESVGLGDKYDSDN